MRHSFLRYHEQKKQYYLKEICTEEILIKSV